jgi:predicted Rossmann-fold nucleotide-binding protein
MGYVLGCLLAIFQLSGIQISRILSVLHYYLMITRLEVPLIREFAGVDQFDHSTSDHITKTITEKNGHVVDLLAAVLDTHQVDKDDIRHLREKFASMQVSTRRMENGEFSLVLEHVPEGVTYDGERITRSQQELVSEVIRDVVLQLPFPPGSSSEVVSQTIRKMVERTGILSSPEGKNYIRSFIWGGHTISDEEYDFAKAVGYWEGLRGTELITGSGGGVMRAPFVGASSGYRKQRYQDRKFIGFTEQGILEGEAPNNLLSTLCVFPDIEKRMEAFIRASHRGRIHPGGTGTMEELMTFLGMKIHKKNEGLVYPFDLVERPDGNYMKRLEQFFRTCFADAIDGLFSFHVESPDDYQKHLLKIDKQLDSRQVWNDKLFVPLEIQTPFEVSFESMQALDLTREQEPFQLIVNLRRFFSGMVHLVVKNPKVVESWGRERPKIKGDKKIIQEVDDLVRWFNDNKRLKMQLKLDKLPYRIE